MHHSNTLQSATINASTLCCSFSTFLFLDVSSECAPVRRTSTHVKAVLFALTLPYRESSSSYSGSAVASGTLLRGKLLMFVSSLFTFLILYRKKRNY